MKSVLSLLAGVLGVAVLNLRADVGDPQIRTDHPWYPGELAISSFERMFATQAEQFERATGTAPRTDEEKALASWFFRNTHYAHGEEGAEDWWGEGFGKGGDTRAREYWTGLFAHGFGLCGTTHSQWTAEFAALLGHGRARGVGASGHNTFEVFLTGGDYGEGQWALLDHDLSTIVFAPEGRRLLSMREVQADWKRLTDRAYLPHKQHGWLVCGLHPADGKSYEAYRVAEYLPGYAGPPPIVHLRRGESLRRYFEPGLEDGGTFVFWGRNYGTRGVPGPERGLTWVNQPEKMHGSTEGPGNEPGRFRYGNAVYVYRPDFANGDYREGVADESDTHVTFAFRAPFVIGAAPPNDDPWGVYAEGGRNGLVLRGRAGCDVSVSVDDGATWREGGRFQDGLDLTDAVKGHRQYLLHFGAGARALAGAGLVFTTVCQANPAVFPRLKDGGAEIRFAASHRAVRSAGPARPHANAHVTAGAFDSPAVTLALDTPRGAAATEIHAAAHVASGSPPRSDIVYQIEYSTDKGESWQPLVKDWTIPRRGDEPGDFWSQSFCYGAAELPVPGATSVEVRFHNNGGKKYLRAEAHLVHRTGGRDGTKVTYAWTDSGGAREEAHRFAPDASGPASAWKVDTGRDVRTRWVEMEPVPAGR